MPDWKVEIRGRLQSLRLAPTLEAAIVEELAQYLDDYYAELLAGGATETEAERRTLAQWTQWELAWRRDDLCPRCRYPVGTSPFCTECGLALDAPALTQAEREDQGNLDPFSAEPKGEEPG